MKWNNFVAFLARNPDIEPWIRHHIGGPSLPMEGDEARQVFVEKVLVSVGVRDFDDLDLSDGRFETIEDVTQTIGGDDSTKRRFWRVLSTRYDVLFHIDREDTPHLRLACVGPEHDGGNTIIQVLQGRTKWHGEYWAKQGKALKFGFVIKKMRKWETPYGSRISALISEKIEIYRFPTGFAL